MTPLELKTRALALWGWLVDRWLYVLMVCAALLLVVSVVGVVKTQETKEATVQAVTEGKLSKKQVKTLQKSNAELDQKAAVSTAKAARSEHRADSTVRIARAATHRADSAVHALLHPAVPDDGLPAHIAQLLLNYAPRAYRLPNGDTLR